MSPRPAERVKLRLFFFITLLWTWTCGFAGAVLFNAGIAAGTFLFYFGAGAPSVTALFMVFITYPRAARRDYFYRCFSFRRMGWKWILWAALFFLLISAAGLWISTGILGYEMPGMDYVHAAARAPYMVLPILLLSLVSGPLNEEFGWRGYALDKLLVRFGFFRASCILGFIWGIWHLPWYFMPGQAQYELLQSSVFEALLFIPSVILLSFVVSFVYLKTDRSILAGALVHLLGNLINSQLLSPYSAGVGTVIRYVKMTFCFALVLYTALSPGFKRELEVHIKTIRTTAVSYTKAQGRR
ncbi:MAG: CPBP family intramembrane metalloprotease [Treponema sp.]|jgi:membrane protease YdiL (CAAX protease family)|nr:CPBP family intramembrane metalloprotease [Treponema sp.]